MDGGAARKRKVSGSKKKGKRASSPSPPRGDARKKPLSIKDRIRAGAKVHVGPRGALYIVYDGKKHTVRC